VANDDRCSATGRSRPIADIHTGDITRSDRSSHLRRLQAEANHRGVSVFPTAPEVRVPSFAGVVRFRRSYDPVQLPPASPPRTALRPLPHAKRVSPRLPERPFPACRAHDPGGRTVFARRLLPHPCGLPRFAGGRHPRLYFTFEACSGFTQRYGPSDCSTAQGGLRHEALPRPVARPDRSSATRAIVKSGLSISNSATAA
jgi:hypothetical protein